MSKSVAKAPAGLVSLEEIRMISRFPSTGELNLDSFVTDLDTSGFPGARSGAVEARAVKDGKGQCGEGVSSAVLPGGGRFHERHVVVLPGAQEDLLPGVGHRIGHEPGDPHDLRSEGNRVNA